MKTQSAIIELLDELLLVLKKMNQEEYCKKRSLFNGTSIGQHIRHIYEFTECLLNHKEPEILSYDDRKRDLELEISLHTALEKITVLKENLSFQTSDYPVLVKHFLGNMGDAIVSSSFKRELLFVFDHTIHHIAIIRIGIESELPHIKLPEWFGFTPSTIRYHNSINTKN